MTEKWTFAGIGRTTGQPCDNIHHFMTNSPWSGQDVCDQVQAEIATTPELRTGGMLLLDESADAKAGIETAGAARQRNGRLGKVDLCQVGVFLSFVKENTWTWVDGELFLPEHWFAPQWADKRERLGIPSDRTFKTKLQLGWEMIQRTQANGLPFKAVGCDDLYGRADWFRSELAGANLVYKADVPSTTQVYLTRPEFGVPKMLPDHRGPKYKLPGVLSGEKPIAASQVAKLPATQWQRIRVRPTERGYLVAEFAVRLVWTMRDEKPTEEWLLVRRDADGDFRYALFNAHAETPVEDLAWMHSQRYFVERSIQDAKSEMGWDEFQAQKFRTWEHQLALTVLASWFVAQTKLRCAQQYPRDPELYQELNVNLLPSLSVANVREALRAVTPLPQLSHDEAADQVVKYLVNRSRSRKSGVNKRSSKPNHRARDPA